MTNKKKAIKKRQQQKKQNDEKKHAPFCFCSNLKKSQGPFVSDFLKWFEKMSETPFDFFEVN